MILNVPRPKEKPWQASAAGQGLGVESLRVRNQDSVETRSRISGYASIRVIQRFQVFRVRISDIFRPSSPIREASIMVSSFVDVVPRRLLSESLRVKRFDSSSRFSGSVASINDFTQRVLSENRENRSPARTLQGDSQRTKFRIVRVSQKEQASAGMSQVHRVAMRSFLLEVRVNFLSFNTRTADESIHDELLAC